MSGTRGDLMILGWGKRRANLVVPREKLLEGYFKRAPITHARDSA